MIMLIRFISTRHGFTRFSKKRYGNSKNDLNESSIERLHLHNKSKPFIIFL